MSKWTSLQNNSLQGKAGSMIKLDECIVEHGINDTDLNTLHDLLRAQVQFQLRLGNVLPESSKNVSFDCVQTALSHNVYQNIELQELMEADTIDRKEELIDYLLFMINKYIYLGVKIRALPEYNLREYLFDHHTDASFYTCSALAQTEQQLFISLIRKHVTFKPWKVRDNETCTDEQAVTDAFFESLSIFRQMANIVYDSYADFICNLSDKLDINVDRQNSGY